MRIIDRISLFIKYKKMTMRSFDASIGMSKGYTHRQVKAGGSVGGEVLVSIVKIYPELNPVWLLTGKGEMILEKMPVVNEGDTVYYASDDFEKMLLRYLEKPVIKEALKRLVQSPDDE